MTAYNPTIGNYRRDRVAFVPTTFFADFLAGAHGQDHDARGHAKHHLPRADVAPALPSRGR